jgi:hypothetical protein
MGHAQMMRPHREPERREKLPTWEEAMDAFLRHLGRGDDVSRRFYSFACPGCGHEVVTTGEEMDMYIDLDGQCEYCTTGVSRGG